MPTIDITDFGGNILSESSDHVFIAHQSLDDTPQSSISDELRPEVFNSWKGCLSVVPIDALSNGCKPSLRQPQVAALFEILGHLTSHKVSDATVVRPTGTGKTETMLAAVCGLPVERFVT